MNIFQIVVLNVLLLLFPVLIYLIYLSTNDNIDKKSKKFYLSFCLLTSFYLIMQYSLNNILISMLTLNSLIIFLYIKNEWKLANFFYILLILNFINQFSKVYFLIMIYLLINILNIIKNKIKLNNYTFINILGVISSLVYIIWIYMFNNKYFTKELIVIFISYFFVINIIHLVYSTSEKILNKNMILKDLEKEKQIRLSLFKITHEIKNPIAVCKGYLDMINVNDSKQVERYIPILKSEIDRLISLLQDYLLINKNNLDIDIMDINMLIEETMCKLNPLLNDDNINLDLNLVDDEVFINGDYNRLSQVLINIIKNSIEAIEDKGKITINSKIKKDKYYLSIIDNGVGMSKETLKKIKEPFFTTKKRGSGLGVSLIYEILEAHDAKIEYDSKIGIGTRINIIFPLKKLDI